MGRSLANIWTRINSADESKDETQKRTVESPQRVNNWRPRRPKFLMRKEKPNRIYIFVPRTLDTSRGKVKMPNGRAAAQCAHAAAMLCEFGFKDVGRMTTIVLAAASTNHLYQIASALNLFKVGFWSQMDTFGDSEEKLLQAIITAPLTEKQSRIFQFSELW